MVARFLFTAFIIADLLALMTLALLMGGSASGIDIDAAFVAVADRFGYYLTLWIIGGLVAGAAVTLMLAKRNR